ncbi:molybdate ABC transporter substrate-binding protein [Ketobacter sp. MCCC 1A13808]|uniref:molybdate ABC transporter substrate-binding protein n=1 Tax=Ketobacter sp. MCCC 1A13808 TaxID=2602738 RepID=UPI000F127E09|nr:molybdate ABC transporter substrate-binding protein [Ketobacter sp. MCCC 1A13808]MVF12479.1 molybdate ABC transporter substrate-binding protein [Ketobacter sp. MCCC 1A13808]RLP55712.1 MAG: molybdate ABC transporter substrate-binding protein [Ketobacter sp.]
MRADSYRRLSKLLMLLLMLVGSNSSIAETTNLSAAPNQNNRPTDTILIAVASNFANVMPDIVSRFETQYGHTVRLSFGSSGKLFAQIRNGAPFQAFFSADQDKPEALVKAHLAPADSRFTYALGVLALWSKEAGVVDPQGQILVQRQYRTLALANPRFAPYGVAAMEVLQRLNVQRQSNIKWVMGENIAQTFQFIATGNADLGFVALSQIYKDGKIQRGSGWIIPNHLHSPISQDAVILRKGKDSQAIKAFMGFMKTDTARAIMRSYGYQQAIE